MNTKTKLLIASAAALISGPLFGANYNYSLTQGEQIDMSSALGAIPTGSDNVTISGPTDSALTDSWVNIDSSFAANYTVLNNGAVMKGEGNYTFTVGTRIAINNGANASQGTSTLSVKGIDDSNRFAVTVTGANKDILLGCDSNSGSSLFEIGGYTTVTATNRLDVGNGLSTEQSIVPKGNSKLLITGQYNTISVYSFNIGSQWQNRTEGSAIVEIVGSTHTISATAAFRLVGGTGTSADNIVGGALSFVADANGISTINVGTVTQVMTGVILLDLGAFILDIGETEEFKLISYSGLQSTYQAWVDTLSDTHFKATGANGEVLIEARADGLYAIYTAIPEPGTYAAMLGAAVLAFAAYRRRK